MPKRALFYGFGAIPTWTSASRILGPAKVMDKAELALAFGKIINTIVLNKKSCYLSQLPFNPQL